MNNVIGKEQTDDAIRSKHEETAEFLYFSLPNNEKMVCDYALGRHGKRALKTDAEIAVVTGLSPSKVNRIRKDLARRIQDN